MIQDKDWMQHRQTLLQQAYRLLRDPTEAQDLVQDTLIRAWRHRDDLRDPDTLLLWMRSILQRLFLNRYRRIRRREEHTIASLDSLHAIGFEPTANAWLQTESVVIRRIEEQAVLRAVTALPAKYRDCILLSDVEGLPYPQIAERLHLSLTTVKTRISRGRRKVRQTLREQGHEIRLEEPGRTVRSRTGHAQELRTQNVCR